MRIEGDLTIYRAAELKAELLAALAEPGDLDLELDAVDEFDTAGVQLLLAARKTAQAAGRSLRLVSPSPVVTRALGTLGLAERFEVQA